MSCADYCTACYACVAWLVASFVLLGLLRVRIHISAFYCICGQDSAHFEHWKQWISPTAERKNKQWKQWISPTAERKKIWSARKSQKNIFSGIIPIHGMAAWLSNHATFHNISQTR